MQTGVQTNTVIKKVCDLTFSSPRDVIEKQIGAASSEAKESSPRILSVDGRVEEKIVPQECADITGYSCD